MHSPVSPVAHRAAPAPELTLAHFDTLPPPREALELLSGAHEDESHHTARWDADRRRIVAARSLLDVFESTSRESTLLNEVWRHSLAVGLIAERLAAAIGADATLVEHAFFAGVFHDIGKLALAAVYPRAFRDVIRAAERRRSDAASCERHIFGVDHTVVGRRLSVRWGLPEWLTQVVWLHHAAPESLTDGASQSALLRVVQVADISARENQLGVSGNFRFDDPPALPNLGEDLSDQQIAAALEGLEQRLEQFSSEVRATAKEPNTTTYSPMGGNAALEQEVNARREATLSTDHAPTPRGAWHAWDGFVRKSAAGCELSELVLLAAEAFRAALGLNGAACVICDDRAAHLLVAWSAMEGAGRRVIATPVDWHARLTTNGKAECVDSGFLRGILIPIAPCLGRGEIRLAPLSFEGATFGWLAYCGANESERIEPEVDPVAAQTLIASLGLCLGLARRRAIAERMTEEMAEANYRMQLGRSEAMRSRTLATIAELAAGAGHELNGPLFVISGRAELLLQRIFDAEAERSLRLIQAKALECSRIVSELMAFARPEPPKPVVVDVRELLSEVRAEWIEEESWPGSRFDVDCHAPLSVVADREQLKAVLLELVRNAAEAVAENEGGITLAARVEIADWNKCGQTQTAFEGASRSFAHLAVRDTGCGMTPSVASRAFEPFYSHRAAGRRRGLGLPRAHRVIEAQNGRIWLESAPNQGTTVHIVLPISE